MSFITQNEQHPAYQSHMIKTETAQQQDEDLEDMPELRYNQTQTLGSATTIHATTTTHTSHVVV